MMLWFYYIFFIKSIQIRVLGKFVLFNLKYSNLIFLKKERKKKKKKQLTPLDPFWADLTLFM